MGLFGWWKRHTTSSKDRRRRQWRDAWAEAASIADDARIAILGRDLDGFGASEDDIEIEREMLQALIDRQALATAVRRGGLPVVQTGHRIVGSDQCHFTVPASMPDRPGQPTGRLLLTNCRAIFIGGTAGTTAPWHAVAAVVHADRVIVLVRRGGGEALRFRCNTFSDTLRAVFIAGELVAGRRSGADL